MNTSALAHCSTVEIEVRKLGLAASVGINTGEVYFGGLGSDEYQKRTVYGTVINLAARLQGMATAGEIYVGEGTYQHARRAFDFEPLSMEVKGFKQQVTAHRVLGQLARIDKVRGIEGLQAEMVGREEDLTKLRGALLAFLDGRGHIATITGVAGIGKSRLVEELKRNVAEHRKES